MYLFIIPIQIIVVLVFLQKYFLEFNEGLPISIQVIAASLSKNILYFSSKIKNTDDIYLDIFLYVFISSNIFL